MNVAREITLKRVNVIISSPIIKLPTRDDLLHPDSIITPEEMLKYRMMQSLSTQISTQHGETLPLHEYSDLEKTKNQDLKCAEASLAQYNMLHSTSYKLIEATDSHGFFCGWVWYHCVFKAAPQASSVPEFFFAELHSLGQNTYHVITVTRVVNVAKSYDCWFCMGKNMLHPVLTLSRDPDLLFSEGMIYPGAPSQEFQEDLESLKGYPDVQHDWQKISSNLDNASHLEPFSQTSEIKDEALGKMRNDFESSCREVYVIDGNNTQISEDAQQTDAAPSHSPIPLPLVDVTPTAGFVKKIIQSIEQNIMRNSGADYVQNKENIQAKSSVSKKALGGFFQPDRHTYRI